MVTTPTVDQVETVYNGNPVSVNEELDNSDASDLIDSAVSMLENLYSDKTLYRSEVRDEDEAVKYLAAHKWALAIGETQSESQAGANITYNVPPATERGLRRTTYGAEFLEYLQSEPNVGMFSTT